jgi:hypothetical protein
MPQPARPFALPADETAAPPPPVWPPQPLPTPSQQGSDGVAHSPTIKWPPAGGPNDAAKPYRSLR